MSKLAILGAALLYSSTAFAWDENVGKPLWRDDICAANDEECEQVELPKLFIVSGFKFWISPTVFNAPEFSHAKLGKEFDVIKAQILWMDSYNSVPKESMKKLREKVSFYLDYGMNLSDWWPCARRERASACYGNGWVGIPIMGSQWDGLTYLETDHTRQNVILHELAHAFHDLIIKGSWHNICIENQFKKVREQYGDVELRAQDKIWHRMPLHIHKPNYGSHWAWQNHHEYFAELSEAMFAFDNHYPWNNNELYSFDPEGYKITWDAWNNPMGFCKEQDWHHELPE